MSNANRDYAIVYDIKNSSLVLSRPLIFYITDRNTSNIFVRLVTRVNIGNGVDQYTDIEEASSYALTMRVIKPNNEVKSIEATQHELESIFQFDLTEDFKDMPGKYICELIISTVVSERQELTTSDPFNYEVKRSILSNVSEIIETEDTTVEKLLNNLEATKIRLFNDLELAKTNLHNDLNATSSALSSQVQASDNKIENIKEELSSQVQASDNKIEENAKKLDERIFKPKFGVSAYWGEVSNTVGGSYTSTIENMRKDIEIWKAHGVDEVVIPLHIGYNETSNDIFLGENLELIRQGCQEIANNGLKIACIKVHVMHLSSANASSVGENTFVEKYTNIITNICGTLNDFNIEYLYPFNEVGWIYNDDSRKNFTLNVINVCKNFGYKVSISTAGAEENFIMSSDIHNSLDAISVNYYQSISSKDLIKNVDAYNSWKGSNLLNYAHYFKSKYPNKEFIVSETGVNDYKEALISPETSFGTERSNGIYQDIYLNGVFNYLNNSGVDRVWWWFGFNNKNNITAKTTNYYLGGAKYEF